MRQVRTKNRGKAGLSVSCRILQSAKVVFAKRTRLSKHISVQALLGWAERILEGSEKRNRG